MFILLMLLLVCIDCVDDWGALFHTKLVDTIYVSLYRSRNDVGIGSESVVNASVVLHLHVYLAHVVRSLRDGLDCKLLQGHLLLNDLLESLDGSIYRTVASRSLFKLLS